MNKYFVDLGANCGQSMRLYSALYPEKSSETVVFCVEASNDPDVVLPLKRAVSELANSYRSIFMFNNAVSVSSSPIVFYDGMGEGSSALSYKQRYTLTRSLRGVFSYLKSKIKFRINPASSYYSAVSLSSFLPTPLSSCEIDLKIDVEGSEYDLISSLAESNNSCLFNNIFIEIHGSKAGKSLLQDFTLLDQSRALSKSVWNWDAAASCSKESVFPLFYADLCNLRLSHFRRSVRLKFLLGFVKSFHLVERFFRLLCKAYSLSFMPIRSSVLFSSSNREFSCSSYPCSIRSLSAKNQYLCSELLDLSDCTHRHLLDDVSRSAKILFDNNQSFASFFSATSSGTLHSHNSSSPLIGEIYRFVENPLLACPEILSLIVSPGFESIFRKYPLLRLAGVHLRRCFVSDSESHTAGFHRDYNSFHTYKTFIPLAGSSSPFLEVIDKSAADLALPHYSPKHSALSSLKPSLSCSVREVISAIDAVPFVDTSCIHRQIPSFVGDVLILTFLPHPDYGDRFIKAKRSDIQSLGLNDWSERFLSFMELV